MKKLVLGLFVLLGSLYVGYKAFFKQGAKGMINGSSGAEKTDSTIEVVPYNSEWPEMYKNEAAPIKKALGDNCMAIHHFGSTSVPGLSAKPKIDILAVVKSFAFINIPALEQLGFEYRGEVIPSGRYLAKADPNIHIHIFEKGNPLIKRNLIFRDWLRTRAADRDAYANLKQVLAGQYTDGMEYCRAKTEFINKIIEKAINQ